MLTLLNPQQPFLEHALSALSSLENSLCFRLGFSHLYQLHWLRIPNPKTLNPKSEGFEQNKYHILDFQVNEL